MRCYYSDDFVAAAHAFDTTRKAKWIADSLREQPIADVELVAPEPITDKQLRAVHDPAYIEAIRTGVPPVLAASSGIEWDPGVWQAGLAAVGGAVAAARSAVALGSNAGCLAGAGHHAMRDSGNGFCTFNDIAVATMDALDAGASHVLIVDLDAHCGGGTHDILHGKPRIHQLDIAVNEFDRYRPLADGWSLDLLTDPAVYLPTLERRLGDLLVESPRFDLCIYNAGMDPFERCAIGGLPGMSWTILRDREEMVFSWCSSLGLPVAFVIAGGYTGLFLQQDELVDLHRLTIEAAARWAR